MRSLVCSDQHQPHGEGLTDHPKMLFDSGFPLLSVKFPENQAIKKAVIDHEGVRQNLTPLLSNGMPAGKGQQMRNRSTTRSPHLRSPQFYLLNRIS
jgi:hypothetical protein